MRQVCAFVHELRWLDLYRVPGVGETLDWAQSLDAIGQQSIDTDAADRTLGALLKAREDLDRVRREGLGELVDKAEDIARRTAAEQPTDGRPAAGGEATDAAA